MIQLTKQKNMEERKSYGSLDSEDIFYECVNSKDSLDSKIKQQ